jgi:hypothetical protein
MARPRHDTSRQRHRDHDPGPAAELPALVPLYAYGTGVTDLTLLAGPPTLTDLYLSDTSSPTSDPLVDATALQNVDVARSTVTEHGPAGANPGSGRNDWCHGRRYRPLDLRSSVADLADASPTRGVTSTPTIE